MAFSPLSFLLGLSAAYVVPIVSRNFRPIAVEAAALTMGFLEDARRVVAEQIENLEDIAAEARAKREQHLSAAAAAAAEDTEAHGDEDVEATPEVPRRRAAHRTRSRES